MTNKRKNVLYVGMTGYLYGQHKRQEVKGFSSRYNLDRLVYYEEYQYVHDAIAREKQLKNWKRRWKEELISRNNPTWIDLASDWFDRDSGHLNILEFNRLKP